MKKLIFAALVVYGGWHWYQTKQVENVIPIAQLPEQSVVLFATKTCPQCQKARDYFADNGVDYLEYRVDDSQAARDEYLKLSKARGVPFIYFDGKTQLGFSEKKLNAMLASKL